MRANWTALVVFLGAGAVLATVGTVVAVRSDVVTGLGLVAMGLSFVVVVGGSSLLERRRERRALAGRPALATVISASDTGVMVNNRPRLRLELEIAPTDGSPPYRVTTRRVVSYGGLASTRPGARLLVSVDRDRRERFDFVDAEMFERIGGSDPAVPDAATPAPRSEGAVLPPDVSAPDDGLIDEAERVALLERLAALHRTGSITDDEFERAKALLLDG